MSRKSYLEQALEVVPGFKTVSEQFLRKYTLPVSFHRASAVI